MSAQLEKTISELKSANNELQKDIESKIKIDQMRREFLNNVSHELKTPIALVQGYAEGLKENISDDPESREFYCDVIMDEAAKMNKLVKNLLTLNQLEEGRDEVAMERFDIVSLIAGVLQSMDIMIQQKEAKVSFAAPACGCVGGRVQDRGSRDELRQQRVESSGRREGNRDLHPAGGRKQSEDFCFQYRNADSGSRSAESVEQIL